MDLITNSSSLKENHRDSATSTPRQRPRRVKMPSDLSGMFAPHENISTPPSVPTLINITRRSSMMMPLAPSLSGSERSIPETEDKNEEQCTPGRKLRRIKRQLLLDSVVKSTSDQMAALQLHSSRSRSGSGDGNMYS